MSVSYNPVNPVLWDDERFVDFDDATRNVWLVLMTGPNRTALPGLQRVGVGGLAEVLRRSQEEVSECVDILREAGMVIVDDRVRVVRLPNGPKHNPAESPNQIRAWWKRWNEIPECRLKWDHVVSLKSFAGLDRPAHAAAWSATFGTVEHQAPAPSSWPSMGRATGEVGRGDRSSEHFITGSEGGSGTFPRGTPPPDMRASGSLPKGSRSPPEALPDPSRSPHEGLPEDSNSPPEGLRDTSARAPRAHARSHVHAPSGSGAVSVAVAGLSAHEASPTGGFTACPDELPITGEFRENAKINLWPDPDAEWPKFVRIQRGSGKLAADWKALFELWLMRGKTFQERDRVKRTAASDEDHSSRPERRVLGLGGDS